MANKPIKSLQLVHNGPIYDLAPLWDNIQEKPEIKDTTYSAGTGLTLNGTTFNHSNSVTAGTAKGSDNQTLSFDSSFTIPTISYDAQGHIIGKNVTTLKMPSNPDTHYESKNVVGSNTSITNTTSALGNGAVYLNSVENGEVTSSHNIKGTGATTVKTDASGNIIINSTNTKYEAGSGLTLTNGIFNHSNSVTPGTAKGDNNKQLTFSGTFTIPTITYDAQGHIKEIGTTTMTMPDNPDTDTTYSAGGGISISAGNQISNSGVRAVTTGTANGTVAVNTNGTVENVEVYGLGSAAFKDEEDFDKFTNQNAFSNISAGGVTIAADTATDTLTIANGTGITISGDATNDKVTITNAGVRSIAQGTANGTIAVNTNGTTEDIKVKGLGSAAFTESSAYAPAGTYAGSSTAGGAATSANKVNKDLKIKLNNGTTEGTNLFTFNGSSAKTINITPVSIGAADDDHNHSEYINQNAFGNVIVGGEDFYADSPTSSLEFLSADMNITCGKPGKNGDIAISFSDISAAKLKTNGGTETQPIYFENGVPKATKYALNKTVPSDAIFKYVQGDGINVSGNVITNIGIRTLTAGLGSTNGTIDIVINGETTSAQVKGLGTAAFTDASDYETPGGSAAKLTEAKNYTDNKVALLMNNSSAALDSIMELANAMTEHQEVTDALEAAIGKKSNKGHTHTVIHTPTGTISKTSITPKGSVSSTFTGTAKSHGHTFTGSAEEHNHTFKGIQGSISMKYTPTGTITTNFTGGTFETSGGAGTQTVATGAHLHKFTPSGSVSQPTFTGSAVDSGAASTTKTVKSVTNVGSLPSLVVETVTNKCLKLVFSAGTVPTVESVTVAGNDHKHSVIASGTVSQPTFTGTEGTVVKTGTTVDVSSATHNHSVTVGGSVTSTFTGTEATLTANYTPSGTITYTSVTPSGTISNTSVTPEGSVSSTFSGTASEHNHGFTGDEATLTSGIDN